MAVRDAKALNVLWHRLYGPARHDGVVRDSYCDDPPGFLAAEGELPPGAPPWIWRDELDRDVLPLADPDVYPLPDPDLHLSPAEATERARSGTLDLQAYCRRSADVIMRGGTSSGIVYPLAMCEMARHFRLRSLGGASAGAIAAAAGAAAELGRLRLARNGEPAVARSPRADGSLRQGYAGLADMAGWLAQLDPGREPEADGSPTARIAEQYRVASLFQATPQGRGLFRIIAAAMRKRTGQAAVLAVTAAGPVAAVVSVVLVGLSVAGLWLSARDDLPRGGWGALTALVCLGALSITGIGASLAAVSAQRGRGRGLIAVGVLVAVATSVAVADARDDPARLTALHLSGLWAAAVSTWFFTALAVLAVQVYPLSRYVRRPADFRYGLVAGADPAPGKGPSQWLDRFAGVPPGTPVVTWLRERFDELAGQPDDTILRFGDLWHGRHVPGEPHQRDRDDSESRLVNLRLMTSELTQGLAYEIPMSIPETLYYDETDLSSGGPSGCVLDQPTIEAMRSVTVEQDVVVADEPGRTRRMRTWPAPEDLPVVVAVRLSLALPFAFQAVPLYRAAPAQQRQDDFGRTFGDVTPPKGRLVVERLWFADGGLTSNFPIRFFDSPLPRWPTLGVNLGAREEEADPPLADIALPPDGVAGRARSRPLHGNLLSYFMSLFATSRNWRDTEKFLQKAFSGRVAEVRLGAGEGDLNIFMERETVASVAIRGIIAGARLRRRYQDDDIWEHHQWLRMQASTTELARTAAFLERSLPVPPYRKVIETDGAEAERIAATTTPGDPVASRAGTDVSGAMAARLWGVLREAADDDAVVIPEDPRPPRPSDVG